MKKEIVPVLPTNRPPTHPGEMLLEEFLKPLGLSQATAAERMGVPIGELADLIAQKQRLSPSLALRLADLLDTDPEIWMDLQSRWDLYEARQAQQAKAS